jgi:hypothetical protein
VQDDGRVRITFVVQDTPDRTRAPRRSGPPNVSVFTERHSSPALHSFRWPMARRSFGPAEPHAGCARSADRTHQHELNKAPGGHPDPTEAAVLLTAEGTPSS